MSVLTRKHWNKNNIFCQTALKNIQKNKKY